MELHGIHQLYLLILNKQKGVVGHTGHSKYRPSSVFLDKISMLGAKHTGYVQVLDSTQVKVLALGLISMFVCGGNPNIFNPLFAIFGKWLGIILKRRRIEGERSILLVS